MTHLARASSVRSAPKRKSTSNALRITPAQRAIAAAMNGVDPERDDIRATRRLHVSERMLHLSVASALRQVLMSRPSTARRGNRRRRGHTDEQTLRDAYYLALALAADADGDPTTLRSTIGRDHRTWVEPASLVGRMQVRFLEQACGQIQLVAGHLPVPESIAHITAGELLAEGGRITETTVLLPDNTPGDSDDAGETDWLHATSIVSIEGRDGITPVDAGPSMLPAAWSARIAAPVTVTAEIGRWPKSVVRDCLWMCEDAVRTWVGSMARQLSGVNNEDLVLQVGPPLRRFLVSPAAAAITRCAAEIADFKAEMPYTWTEQSRLAADDLDVDLGCWPGTESSPSVLAAVDVDRTVIGKQARLGLLKTLRSLPGGRQELGGAVELPGAVALTDIYREEIALLSAAAAEDFTEIIDVTANIEIPDWEDVTNIVADLHSGGVAQLTSPVIGWTDRDVVSGDYRRLTLRVRAHRGIALRGRSGFGVFLAPGIKFTVLGCDVSKYHCTVYLDQQTPTGTQGVAGVRSIFSGHAAA